MLLISKINNKINKRKRINKGNINNKIFMIDILNNNKKKYKII